MHVCIPNIKLEFLENVQERFGCFCECMLKVVYIQQKNPRLFSNGRFVFDYWNFFGSAFTRNLQMISFYLLYLFMALIILCEFAKK